MRRKHLIVNKKQLVRTAAVVSMTVFMALQATGCSSQGASGKESTTAQTETSSESSAAPDVTSAAAVQSAAGEAETTAASQSASGEAETTAAVQPAAGKSETTAAVQSSAAAKTDGDSGTDPKPGAALKEGNKAPDFTAQLLDGSTVKLSDLRGEPVLINFWATWCGPCVGEMPAFQRLQKDYGDKIHIIAVNAGEDEDTVRDFIKSNNYTFPVALDEDYDVASLYPTNGIPYTVVVDANGKITHVSTGALDADTMYQRYKEALGL